MYTQDGTIIVSGITGRKGDEYMPRDKIKPPAETKAQLMEEVSLALSMKWTHDFQSQVEFLLNFFTAADLVGIREELKK